MQFTTRAIILLAMVILTVVSMWTTYVSLHDSILPAPEIAIPLPNGQVWQCSVFALLLSVAIGLMLFALKMAIIDEQKRLNLLGLAGLLVVGFISISFNIDVLYRIADRDFFLDYSNSHMKSAYEDYLTQVQSTLVERRDEVRKRLALQEGELESEVKGLREAPAGFGERAKAEQYELTLLEKEGAVELDTIEEAILAKESADELLAVSLPEDIRQVRELQEKLRAALKDAAALSGISLPPPVELPSPLFAVFSKLFDWRNIGFKEVFFVLIAIFLDLGDIIGYSMVPDKPGSRKGRRREEPEFPAPFPRHDLDERDSRAPVNLAQAGNEASTPGAEPQQPPDPARRPVRFRRRF